MAAFAGRTTRNEVIAGYVCPRCDHRKITVRARGIVCRTCCGRPLAVTTTYKAASGVVFRYHRCTGCGLKVRTREQVDPAYRPRVEKSAGGLAV
jgi:hypothetical protein